MKTFYYLKAFYHFLGSIQLAIFLIGTTALSIVIGTFLEGYSDSHLYALNKFYHHPLFALLLGLFFVNILVSALRRWPFHQKHIPFLITHLGLLMIISGTIIKQQYGLQGNLYILEGSGSQSVLIPYTQALKIEKKGSGHEIISAILPLSESMHSPLFPDLKLKVLTTIPHTEECPNHDAQGRRSN